MELQQEWCNYRSVSRENVSSDQQNQQFQQQQQYHQQQHSHQYLLRQSLINLTSAHNTNSSNCNYDLNSSTTPQKATETKLLTPLKSSKLQKSNSCSCESLKCTTTIVSVTAVHNLHGDRSKAESELLISNGSGEKNPASSNIYSVDCDGLSNIRADEQPLIQNDHTTSNYCGISKQSSYESYNYGQYPQVLSLAGKSHNYLDCTNTNLASNSPNSCATSSSTGGVPSACDDFNECTGFELNESNKYTHSDLRNIVVHNFSKSDPITRYSNLEDRDASSFLKSHYSDCNIYPKPHSGQHLTNLKIEHDNNQYGGDKQQLVNKTYIFKCIANSPPFIKANKIKEQSKKLRNLSLKTRTVKKKNQIISKTNAVSDNSLHPGDKYLNLYLVEKKSVQQSHTRSSVTGSISSNSPSGNCARQLPAVSAVTRYQQLVVNGSVKSYPTYRSTVKSDIKDYSTNSSFSNKFKPSKINNKNCNLFTGNANLSVSTNSCNKLHATQPYAISPKSSLSSNGHLNKHFLTDITRRKTEFNRQLSAPTDYTQSYCNGFHFAANEPVCESTSTVASAGINSAGALKSHHCILPKQTSYSCTNSFNRPQNKKNKNTKLNER
ncbi:rho GTPase-activating protein gacF-like [Teleopsis dalmanni]|uniref:rho GTPase-activating protein gacF-like n=1 Tax=Teleopsis dalmanni TaxID=139649 RepID=UPI0018CE55C6|nr:rho GTPase-activating protein gacF-like [Teleopsis dalmanni]